MENTSPPTTSDFFSPFRAFQDFILKRDGFVKKYRQHPPHSLGICILLLVSLELVLSRRLIYNQATGPDVVGQFIGTALVILLLESLIISSGRQIAYLFHKKGSIAATYTYFNLALAPFLLFLPATLLIWATGISDLWRFFFLILLLVKVIGDWKKLLEGVYRLTRWQGALVMLSLGILVYLLAPIILAFGTMDALIEIIQLMR